MVWGFFCCFFVLPGKIVISLKVFVNYQKVSLGSIPTVELAHGQRPVQRYQKCSDKAVGISMHCLIISSTCSEILANVCSSAVLSITNHHVQVVYSEIHQTKVFQQILRFFFYFYNYIIFCFHLSLLFYCFYILCVCF